MKPTNSKSLLAFVFSQMEKLDNKEIDFNTANSQAKLIQQANNLIRSEHERARVKIEIIKANQEFKSSVELREIESINFS